MLDRIKKKQFQGFKEFVQSMEITAMPTRQQIFITGVLEDPVFMSWVMKNIKTFDDVMKLPGDDLDAILGHQDQILSLFAKTIKELSSDEIQEISKNVPRFASRLKDELSYLGEISATEKQGAKMYLVKTARHLQMEELIKGFGWALPPMELFYPKTYPDGFQEINFESGILAATGEYFKGKRSGPWKHYYDNGKLLAEGDYYDGHKLGTWTFFYSGGNVKSQGKFKLDQRQGIWKEYDREGKVTEHEFKDGSKV